MAGVRRRLGVLLQRPLNAQGRRVKRKVQFCLLPVDIAIFPEKNSGVRPRSVHANRQCDPRNIRKRFGHQREIALIEKQTGPQMCAEATDGLRTVVVVESPDVPVDARTFAGPQIVNGTAAVFTAHELEIGDFNRIVIDDATKKQAAMLFLAKPFVLQTFSKAFDEIER